MGQGASSGYPRNISLIKKPKEKQDSNNNSKKMSELKKIQELEKQLKAKEQEIEALQVRKHNKS